MTTTATNQYVLENEVTDDFDINDIEDMPGFTIPPSGSYTVIFEEGITDVVINGANYYQLKATITSVEEVLPKDLNDDETVPVLGDIATFIYGRNNKFGMDNFKSVVRPVAMEFGVSKISAIREKFLGLSCLMLVKRKFNQKADKYIAEIVRLAPL